jgi:succinate dehydrogenase / fumarate reductase iron-sulfur subunit
MTVQAQAEDFGHCTAIGECEAVCPAHVKMDGIARMNSDFVYAVVWRRPAVAIAGTG